MSFPAEAQIARELMKFAANGTLYRGSKPVMWSVVEKTALAEAEVEYEGLHERYGVGEVSGDAVLRTTSTRLRRTYAASRDSEMKLCRDLDHYSVDHSRQSRD